MSKAFFEKSLDCMSLVLSLTDSQLESAIPPRLRLWYLSPKLLSGFVPCRDNLESNVGRLLFTDGNIGNVFLLRMY